MPVRTTTTLSSILTNVRTRLINFGTFGADTVFISLNPERIQHPPSTLYGIITPTVHAVIQPTLTGAGNNLLQAVGNINITIWSSNGLDESSRDEKFLIDSSLGVLIKKHSVMDALEQFDPTDSNNDFTLHIPMRLTSIQAPSRDGGAPYWGSITMTYEVIYGIDADGCG